MDHSITRPRSFGLVTNCTKCQMRAKKILSTLIGSINSIEVEDKGNAGGRVTVKSTVNPSKFSKILEDLVKTKMKSCGGPTPSPNEYPAERNSQTQSEQKNINSHTPNEQQNNSHVSVGQSLFQGHQGVDQLHDLTKNKNIKQLELVQNLRINFSEERNHECSQKVSECDDDNGTPPIQEHISKVVIDSTQHGVSNATNTGDTISKSVENGEDFCTPPLSFDYTSPSTLPKDKYVPSGSKCCIM